MHTAVLYIHDTDVEKKFIIVTVYPFSGPGRGASFAPQRSSHLALHMATSRAVSNADVT